MSRKTEKKYPIIALVGRTNVGKSTLFNRLIEENKALVSDIEGTTRTRNVAQMFWRGIPISVVDTGGLTLTKDLLFEKEVVDQAERAVVDADVILFMVDVQAGIITPEKKVAAMLRKNAKKVILIGNKADAKKHRLTAVGQGWEQFGFGEPMLVSAKNGSGVGDALDAAFKLLPTKYTRKNAKKVASDDVTAKVTLLGKPNVGKSSLLNALTGDEEVIVSDVPHTTRESFDIDITYNDKVFRIIDTAGIRRKSRVQKGLERIGVAASVRAIDEADVVLLLLDATDPNSAQEKHLAGLVENKHAGIVLVVNKWDLVEDHSTENRTNYIKSLRRFYPFLSWAPIHFISAKTGFRTHQLFDIIEDIAVSRAIRIDEDTLTQWAERVMRKHKPSRGKGTRQPKILSFRQTRSRPPSFDIVIKFKTSLHRSYIHYLKNELRKEFKLEGVPIKITISKTKKI